MIVNSGGLTLGSVCRVKFTDVTVRTPVRDRISAREGNCIGHCLPDVVSLLM